MNNLYRQITLFLHNADLLLFMMLASIPHYYGALRVHDSPLVAISVAIFWDLLHFRSSQKAVSKDWKWKAVTFYVVFVSFGLQFIYYSQHEATPLLYRLLFSSIIPIGAVILAWHKEDGQAQTVAERVANETKQLRAELEQERVNCEQVRAKNEQLQAMLSDARTELDNYRLHCDELEKQANGARDEARRSGQELAKVESLNKRLQSDVNNFIECRDQWEQDANAGKQAQTLLGQIKNPLILDILEMSAAGENVNARKLADKHGMKPTAVHNRIKFVLGGE